MSSTHAWRYFRAGGLDQVLIETTDDLRHLGELDQKLWVALACPTQGLEIDSRTLQLLDLDGDGRLRPPEIVAAATWLCGLLKEPASSLGGRLSFPLAALDDRADAGKAVLVSARRVLTSLGRPDGKELSVADVSDTVAVFAATLFNGDGVVPADAAEEDAEARELIEAVIARYGAVADRSGKPGVDKDKVAAFRADLDAFDGWWASGEGTEVLPLGADTPAAFAALSAVRAKVDDWFARCRIAAFDARATDALNRAADTYVALADKDLSALGADVAGLPLQHVAPGLPLTLTSGVNPAWQGPVDALRAAVVAPLLGADVTSLDEATWASVKAKLAPYEAWLGSKAGALVEDLGVEKVRALRAGDAFTRVDALIARDVAAAPELAAIEDVEKVVRLYRDFGQLVRNFVNFAAFYDRNQVATFEAGTLYLDQRSCGLCVKVGDIGGHASLASLSNMYLAYCQCTRAGATMNVVVGVTQGDSDLLRVGRRGVFYDREGKDWDAAVVRVVENPISIGQAFWLPYKRVARLIEEQVEKFASSREADVQTMTTSSVTDASTAVVAGAPPAAPPAPFDVAKFAGIFAAVGLAVGSIGTALAAVVSGFLQLDLMMMPLALGGLMLLISGPSMLLAALKLRQRTIGPVLEGNGWAVNGRVVMNIPLGATFTDLKALPPGKAWGLEDPFIDKAARRRKRVTTLLVLVALGLAGWFWAWPAYVAARDAHEAPPAPAAAEPAAPAEAPAAP